MTQPRRSHDPLPTVSVLIPAFEVADIIQRAIHSALDQSPAPGKVEVIVIDDASRDETRAVAQALASKEPRIRVLHLENNAGPGASRAEGLAAARGRWIAVLDADDSMQAGRLDRLICAAEERKLDLIADNLILCDPEAGEVGVAFPLEADAVVPLSAERVLANSIPGGRVNLGWMQPVIRRDFLLEHQITWRPVRHAEDTLFLMEVLLAGARAELIGEPGYLYTQRLGSVSGSASPHSRTQRDADEQIRAIELLEQHCGPSMPRALRRHLRQLQPEIRVTTRVIHGLENWRQGRYLAAAGKLAAASASPLALARCVSARFGPRGRRVV